MESKKLIGFAVVLTIAAVLFSLNDVSAALGINKQLTYNGILKDSSGSVVADGNYDMVFKIYADTSTTTPLWTGNYTAANGNPVEIKSGNFTVLLGSGTGNTMTLDFNDDSYYVGITVGTDSEMTPRQRIGAAGYAFNADQLDGIDSLSFLRSDAADTMAANSASSILTITQSGAGDILNLFDGANEVFTVLNGGNVGIGITNPGVQIHAAKSNSSSAFYLDTYDDGAQYSELRLRKSDTDTIGIKTTTDNNDRLGLLSFYGIHAGSGWNKGAQIEAIQDGAAGITFVPTNLILSTNSASGENSNQLVLHNDGNIGIGTVTPTSRLEIISSGSSTTTSALNIINATSSSLLYVRDDGRVGIGTTNPGGTLGLKDANTYISVDGSNNLIFTDAVTGTKTLAQLALSSGGGGLFTTTSDNLALHPIDSNDVLILGGTATTTSGNIFEVIGSSLFDNVTVGGALSVTATTTLSGNTIISGNTTLTNASSTNQNISGYLSVGGSSVFATTTISKLTITGDAGINSTLTANLGLVIASSTPATTTLTLYNNAGTLYWNGTQVGTSITDDSLDFDKFVDSMSLDSTTTITFATSGLVFNLNDTGDFDIQDNGVSVLTVNDNGQITISSTTTARDIIPAANLTYSLGSSANRWNEAWIGTLQVGTSTVALSQAPGGGLQIIDVGTTTAAVIISPSNQTSITNLQATVGQITSLTATQARIANGTAALPSLAFSNYTDTGLFSTAGALHFATAGSERMRIDLAGNVGIGTTTPATKLVVQGGITLASTTPATTTQALYAQGSTLYWNGSSVGGVSGGTQGQTLVFDSTGSAVATSTLFMTSAGNIGIGTTTPTSRLFVDSGAATSTPILTLANQAGDFRIFNTNLTPTSTLVADVGDLAIDSIAGKLYIKSSGTGNSIGWVEFSQEAQAVEYLQASIAVDQVNLSNNDNIKFDTVDKSSGSNISLNTGTGIFTLQAGKTYRLTSEINFEHTAAAIVQFAWYDITNSTEISERAMVRNAASVGDFSTNPVMKTIFTPTVNTQVSVRVVADGSNVEDVNSGFSWALIETIADGSKVAQFTGATAGAAGTTGFLLAPDAGDQGSVLLGNASWSNPNALFIDTSTNRVAMGATTTLSNILNITGGIGIASSTPATTTLALYNNSGVLYWDGSQLAGITGTEGYTITFDSVGAQVATSTLFVSSAGNIGIGTTTPGAVLHVASDIAGDSLKLTNALGATTGMSLEANGAGGRSWALYSTQNSASEGQGKFLVKDTTASQVRLTIDSSGNVGIGTSTPAGTLHVANASSSNALVVAVSGNVGIRTNSPAIELAIGDTDTGLDWISDGELNFLSNTIVVAKLGFDGSNQRFFLPSVDDDAAENPVCRSSSGELSRGSAGCNTSSLRYKENVQDMNYGLNEVLQLRPVTYEKKVNPGKIQFGLIAEEVALIFPEIIGYEPDDPTLIQTYDYRGMHSVLIKAIQEQQEQIEALQATIPGLDLVNLETENEITVADKVFEGNITVRGHATFSGDSVGLARIKKGGDSVRVTFENKYQNQPIVMITLMNEVNLDRYFVTDIDTSGFAIKISPVHDNVDIDFSWHAFGGEGAKIHVSDGTTEDIEIVVIEPELELISEPESVFEASSSFSEGDQPLTEEPSEEEFPEESSFDSASSSDESTEVMQGEESPVEELITDETPTEPPTEEQSTEEPPAEEPSVDKGTGAEESPVAEEEPIEELVNEEPQPEEISEEQSIEPKQTTEEPAIGEPVEEVSEELSGQPVGEEQFIEREQVQSEVFSSSQE